MATINNAISRDLFSSVLPTFGTLRKRIPVWDEGQKMFICDQYQSECGNFYYRGFRFCDRIAIVEKVGLFKTWTYIDSIEIYAFNGRGMELIQKQDYNKVFRDEAFIRSESAKMITQYLTSVAKTQGLGVSPEQMEAQAQELVDKCFKSFLDADYQVRLTQILPTIENKQ
ncbi:MAG: hypothetical protein IKJ90_00615 [Bacteroidaceae bacterium]|jgi:hypothetical protein|nr:hypothetical protein [Bacteroidaceae bacterium]